MRESIARTILGASATGPQHSTMANALYIADAVLEAIGWDDAPKVTLTTMPHDGPAVDVPYRLIREDTP